MKKYGFILFLSFFIQCLIGTVCWAEIGYVTDSIKITLRTGPSIQHKIIIMLESGQSLDIIETKDDWRHVRLVNEIGKEYEGWVMNRYTTMRQPWKDQALFLKQQNNQLKDKLSRIDKQWKETDGREKEISAQLTETSRSLDVLQNKYEELKRGAAKYLELKKEYEEMQEKLRSYTHEVDRLTIENAILLASQRNRWLGIGAVILLCGLMIGISMGRHQKKQKGSVLY